MRLPLDDDKVAALFELLDGLERLGLRSVLVGGLVPPLLLAALDPEGFDEERQSRRTADCDLALDLAVTDGEQRNQEAEALLTRSGWSRRRAREDNQFRWTHACKLLLDVVPVPAGVESGDAAAVAFARRKLDFVKDPARFYRGYELAVMQPIEISIEVAPTAWRTLRIAGLPAFLAMKLQTWLDRGRTRKRDAYDVAWLLRFTPAEIAIAALAHAAQTRPDLVSEIRSRLREDFADEWDRGIRAYASEKYPYRDEDLTEVHRGAAARAVQRVLQGLEGAR